MQDSLQGTAALPWQQLPGYSSRVQGRLVSYYLLVPMCITPAYRGSAGMVSCHFAFRAEAEEVDASVLRWQSS